MNALWQSFVVPASPILTLFGGGALLIGLECFPGRAARVKLAVACFAAIAASLLGVCLFRALPLADAGLVNTESGAWLVAFAKNYRLDALSAASFIAIGAFTAVGLVFASLDFRESQVRTEILALLLFIASGMMVLVSASHLLIAFLGLELLSLPTYVLVGLRRGDRLSTEAALKYFLFGSLATVFFVLGLAFVYAQAGTLHLNGIHEAAVRLAAAPREESWLFVGGMALLLAASAFKVGAVPFHMWVPDAYQGAPTAITGFMGSAVKLAGFAMMARLCWEAFQPFAVKWSPLLLGIAAASMVVGNVAAIAQTNVKRLFAYSSIGHAGTLLLGVAVAPMLPHAAASGSASVYYYLLTYGLMFLGLFGVLAVVERETGSLDMAALNGFGFQRPFLGFCLSLFVLAAAGIPPTAGFFAKYFIFTDGVQAGHSGIVITGLIASVVGAAYYLRVLVALYMREPQGKAFAQRTPWLPTVIIGLCALALVVLSVRPKLAWNAALRAYPAIPAPASR